jgi:hypothetical protein
MKGKQEEGFAEFAKSPVEWGGSICGEVLAPQSPNETVETTALFRAPNMSCVSNGVFHTSMGMTKIL